MSETPRSDHDAQLTSVYRATLPEQPPAALDDAIRAAARRAVAARPQPVGGSLVRRWQTPLSIAAVLVLCVSLVAVMHEEGGELTSVPRADAPERTSPRAIAENASAVPKIELAPETGSSRSLGLKLPGGSLNTPLTGKDAYGLTAPGAQFGMRRAPAEQDVKHGADAPARQVAPAALAGKQDLAAAPAEVGAATVASEKARREAALASAVAPASAVGESRGKIAAAGNFAATAEPASAARPPAVADRAERNAAPAAPAPAVRPALEAGQAKRRTAEPALVQERLDKESVDAVASMAQLPPEKWLARIEELRRSGRNDEARAGLAEFRKRYPDFVLPSALREWALQ